MYFAQPNKNNNFVAPISVVCIMTGRVGASDVAVVEALLFVGD